MAGPSYHPDAYDSISSVSEPSTVLPTSGNGNTSLMFEPSVSHVSSKMVDKIRLGKLVDMGKLVRKDSMAEDAGTLTLKDGKIEISEQAVPITSFYKWLDPFVVFMSIRGRFWPNEFQGMLRHIELVKQVFADGNDGSLYDYSFRARKADFQTLPWGQFMPELVRPASKPSAKGKGPQKQGQRQKPTKTAKCNFYNFGVCTRKSCPYVHSCLGCHEAGHGMSACPKGWKKGAK